MKINEKIQMTKCQRQGGFALTELLLTIGIIALVLSAIAAIAITTSAGQTAQSEARVVDSAANKIRSIYSSRPDFADLDLASSVSMEAWPSSMVSSNGTDVYNAWGGAVEIEYPVTEQYSNQNQNRLFRIKTANVSENACGDLATANTSAVAIEVDGTRVYERGSATHDPVVVTGGQGVSDLCVEGVEISFIYGKNA